MHVHGYDRLMSALTWRQTSAGMSASKLPGKLMADGTWAVRLNLPEAGAYRVFTLGADLAAAGAYEPRPPPRPQLVRTMIEKLVDYAVNDPRRARVFFGEMAATEAASHQRVLAIRRIVTILAANARTIHHADHPMIDLTASVLVNGSIRTLVDWLDGTIALTRDQFIDNLTTLWLITSEGAVAELLPSHADAVHALPKDWLPNE